MNLEQLKRQLNKIANQRPDGFTFSLNVEHFAQSGYAVASSDTQDCLGMRGLHRVLKYVLRHRDYCIGGWKNEDGTMQFDASRIYLSVEEAISAAIQNKQRAIFDLNTGRTIMACEYEKYYMLAYAA